jgi:hypothetical protein
MADQDQLAALGDVTFALIVNFRDQRAGGVKDWKTAGRGLFLHAFGYAVGAEDGDRIRRHFVQVFDENRAFGFQALDYVLVVHDLVADIDRRPILLQRAFDDFDRAHNPRRSRAAEPAGFSSPAFGSQD